MLKAHKIASVLHVLDASKDSVEYYLNVAVEASHERACFMLQDLEAKRSNGTQRYLLRTYFAKEFSKEWWDIFVKSCPNYSELKRKNHVIQR